MSRSGVRLSRGVTSRIELVTGILILPNGRRRWSRSRRRKWTALRRPAAAGWARAGTMWYDTRENFHNRGRRQVAAARLWAPKWSISRKWHRVDRAGISRCEAADPIWFGGYQEEVFRRAARLGDGFIFGGPQGMAMAARLREWVAEAGRDGCVRHRRERGAGRGAGEMEQHVAVARRGRRTFRCERWARGSRRKRTTSRRWNGGRAKQARSPERGGGGRRGDRGHRTAWSLKGTCAAGAAGAQHVTRSWRRRTNRARRMRGRGCRWQGRDCRVHARNQWRRQGLVVPFATVRSLTGGSWAQRAYVRYLIRLARAGRTGTRWTRSKSAGRLAASAAHP
jgi:hypothetical protein